MKVMINTTPPTNTGGVANHYKGLKKYWKGDVRYNYIGGRYNISGYFIIVYDIIKFFFKCLFTRPDIVVLNPSLGKTALVRDGLYLKVSKYFKLKTIVFFHGWKERQVKRISKNPDIFLKKFSKADCFLVLASSFRDKMREWGVKKPILLTTTKVDNTLIEKLDITNHEFNNTLLYLARVEEKKGIFIALKAFEQVIKKFPEAQLVIAGDGEALLESKKFVRDHNLEGVHFKGYVSGDDLVSTFKYADIYMLPSYSEGMPTSVLEAMAFGLPVITRPVGGLVDIFQDGNMGFLINGISEEEFAAKACYLLRDPEKIRKIGLYNHQYALSHFTALKIASELEEIFQKLHSGSLTDSKN